MTVPGRPGELREVREDDSPTTPWRDAISQRGRQAHRNAASRRHPGPDSASNFMIFSSASLQLRSCVSDRIGLINQAYFFVEIGPIPLHTNQFGYNRPVA